MKSFLIFAFVLFGCPGPDLGAQSSPVDDVSARSPVEDRLEKSAIALRMFQENVSEPARTLLANAHCIAVAPRRDPGQSGAEAKGFVSCRKNRNAAWSNPAAVVISDGGTYWPVVGTEIDLIILAMNQSTASHFGDRESWLGSPNLSTTAGPVQQDQVPLQNYPIILAYQQSIAGTRGINIAGSAVREDRAANAVLYGRELSNLAILNRNGGGAGKISVDVFLTALSPSVAGQSGGAIAAEAASPKTVVVKPE